MMTRSGAIRPILLLFAVSSRVTRAQDTSSFRLSTSLYFADSVAESIDRAALHARVEPLTHAVADADSHTLVQRLRDADQLVVSLQRHAAYLKVKTLENVDDRAAKDAVAGVNTDQALLRTAVSTRLERVPTPEIPALGRYAKLARDAQRSAAQRLSPEVLRYRQRVTQSVSQSIVDAYDKQIAALRGFGPVGSPDLATRRGVLARRAQAFDNAAPAMASLLGALVDLGNRDATAQGFHDAVERQYASLGVSESLVNRTLAAVAEEARAYRRYEQLIAERAAKKLGVETILADERDLGSAAGTTMTFDRGRQFILDALALLGSNYVQRFGRLLDESNGRLDFRGGSHRATTGTSIVAFDAPTALYLTRYTGTLSNLGVIAHEGGHALHYELMNADSLPVYQRRGPHHLFEGYAIFNEWLVLDHAASVATTPQEHEHALEALLSSMAVEIFVSAEETSFEQSLYVNAARGLLDRTRIDDLFRASLAPYEFFPMSDVGSSRGWMTKSLLFQDPLYLVNYLYASLVAVALWDRARTDPDFARNYEALLRRGFDADPSVLLATLGIELGDPAVIRRASALFKAKTDELERLYAADP